MPALVAEYLNAIQTAVQQDQQVVLIYNALADLRRDLPTLLAQFHSLGIPANQVLVINSIDDSTQQSHQRYQSGRQQNPDAFTILIATASVEMGVTFRAANLMLMESGFAPMNFLQRYGRAARRGADGLVAVRLDNASLERHPWLRTLQTWGNAHQQQTVSILELSQVLSQEAQQAFQTSTVSTESTALYFGALPQQAVYTSGLYWQLLLRHPSTSQHRKDHLRQHQPDSSKWAYSKLRQLEPLLQDPTYAKAAKQWQTLLFMQAMQLRNIGKRVLVVEADGRELQIDRVWLERETDIMRRFPPRYDEREQAYFQLQGELDDYLLDDKNRAMRRLDVYFPHTKCSLELESNNRLISEWRKVLTNQRDDDTEAAWEDYPEAMQAAEQLVVMTGLIPSSDTEISTSTASLVW
jgi:hypothetical protein